MPAKKKPARKKNRATTARSRSSRKANPEVARQSPLLRELSKEEIEATFDRFCRGRREPDIPWNATPVEMTHDERRRLAAQAIRTLEWLAPYLLEERDLEVQFFTYTMEGIPREEIDRRAEEMWKAGGIPYIPEIVQELRRERILATVTEALAPPPTRASLRRKRPTPASLPGRLLREMEAAEPEEFISPASVPRRRRRHRGRGGATPQGGP
jgi:hypothetical protein